VRVARRVGALAGNTFREAVRNKLLYNLLLFAMLMITSSVVIADLHLGHAKRIYLDFGLSAIALFGTLIAIFVGINLVYREISLKTVYTLLAKPVHRWEFLLGKYAGLVALLLLEVAIMAGCFFALLFLQKSEVTWSLVLAVGMIFLELTLITAVAIFFSSFTTPYLAGMFTVALWIIGHLLADLRAFGDHSEIASLNRLTEVLYWTLPNLDRLDIKGVAAAGKPLEGLQLAVSALYAVGYSTMLLLASVVLFRRRDFR
jgi:ABC-type transport system involved in multi-copper enzyme maturation permease subunit